MSQYPVPLNGTTSQMVVHHSQDTDIVKNTEHFHDYNGP